MSLILELVFTLQPFLLTPLLCITLWWHHLAAENPSGCCLEKDRILQVRRWCRCCRRDQTLMAWIWWTSAVFQPGKSGLCSCTSTMFLLQLARKWELSSTENIFWLSNVCFHFFSDLNLSTFFRLGEMEGSNYIHPKPSLSSGLDWDDSNSESSFSLSGPWVKSRWVP